VNLPLHLKYFSATVAEALEKILKHREMKNIRITARLFGEGYRDINNKLSSVPKELLTKIAAHTADEHIVNDEVANKEARLSFTKRGQKK
jgi:hypothetical protein